MKKLLVLAIISTLGFAGGSVCALEDYSFEAIRVNGADPTTLNLERLMEAIEGPLLEKLHKNGSKKTELNKRDKAIIRFLLTPCNRSEGVHLVEALRSYIRRVSKKHSSDDKSLSISDNVLADIIYFFLVKDNNPVLEGHVVNKNQLDPTQFHVSSSFWINAVNRAISYVYGQKSAAKSAKLEVTRKVMNGSSSVVEGVRVILEGLSSKDKKVVKENSENLKSNVNKLLSNLDAIDAKAAAENSRRGKNKTSESAALLKTNLINLCEVLKGCLAKQMEQLIAAGGDAKNILLQLISVQAMAQGAPGTGKVGKYDTNVTPKTLLAYCLTKRTGRTAEPLKGKELNEYIKTFNRAMLALCEDNELPTLFIPEDRGDFSVELDNFVRGIELPKKGSETYAKFKDCALTFQDYSNDEGVKGAVLEEGTVKKFPIEIDLDFDEDEMEF